MCGLLAIMVSNTLHEPLDWPHVTVQSGDPADIVAGLEEGPTSCCASTAA